MSKNIISQVFLFISVFLLIVLEFFCAKLAFETVGEVASAGLLWLVALNIIPLTLLIVKKQKEIALGLLLLIALILIPTQLYLEFKLLYLKEEAANIIAFAYEQKVATGNFPNDLSAYTFSFPKLQKHFSYHKESDQAFKVLYYVGAESTSHFYNSEHKKWGYYPD